MEKDRRDFFCPELRGCQCIKHGENIFFFAKNFNALSKINIKKNTIEIVGSFLGEGFDREYLVSSLLNYENEIICVPNMAGHIYVVDLNEKNKMKYITLENEPLCERAFRNAYMQDEYCFFFPFRGRELLKVDLKQKKVIKSINVKRIYKDIFGEDYTFFSCSGIYMFENKLYMVMFENATIIQVDIGSMNINFYNFNGRSTHYIHLVGCGGLIFILGVDGKIYIWNCIKHTIENTIQLKFKEEGNERYCCSVKYARYIYIFKYIPADEFIRIDIETNHIEILSMTDVFSLDQKKDFLLTYVISEGAKFYFLSESLELLIIDFDTKVGCSHSLLLNIDNMCECIRAHEKELSVLHSEPILEGSFIWTLKNYLRKYICMNRDKQDIEDESKGNRIYEVLKKGLG